MKLSMAIVLACAVPMIASAQNYPARPIRVIVPFAPGTGPEQTVRLFNEKFLQSTGQPQGGPTTRLRVRFAS